MVGRPEGGLTLVSRQRRPVSRCWPIWATVVSQLRSDYDGWGRLAKAYPVSDDSGLVYLVSLGLTSARSTHLVIAVG